MAEFPILEQAYHRERYNMTWRLSLAFTFIFAVLSALFFNSEPLAFLIYLTVFCLSVFSLIWLKYSSNYKVVIWLFSSSATALVIYSVNSIVDTMHYSDLLWIVNIILFAYVGLSKKEALLFVVIHALALTYFCIYELNHHLENIRVLTNVELMVTSIEILFAFFVMAYLFHANIKFQNHVQLELHALNSELERKNREITTLLMEVHHRVKNNLQIVVSLLRIQQSELNSEELRLQFQEAVNRVITISAIHEKLYKSKELSNLNFTEYITTLLNDFEDLFEHRNMKLSFESSLESVDLKSVVPVGLILNELITNTVKHHNSSMEEINIHLKFTDESNGFARLEYNDFNEWEGNSKGFGLELIESLTEQLEGTITRNGSLLKVTFRSDFGI